MKCHSDAPATSNRAVKARVFVYQIDHADKIISVDDPWLEFARDNDAPELTLAAVQHQEIWKFIDDVDTRAIYHLIFNAVRNRNRTLTVSYRCDSPTLRRFMTLTCKPISRLGIELRSRIEREEPRPYVSVLDRNQPRSESVITICAWCRQCKISDDDWREIEYALPQLQAFDRSLPPQVSHGMCPECYQDKITDIQMRMDKQDGPIERC